MYTLPRTSTTEMEVTSIRLEKELKIQLKKLAGNQGYQAMVRDILWNYVQQRSQDYQCQYRPEDIRSTMAATANQEERCAITGTPIHANQPMLLGLTQHGELVPLSLHSLT